MRRDRTGELVDEQPSDEHRCRYGWIDRETAHPCPTCRPWLVERPARPPTDAELHAFRRQHPDAAS